MGGKERWWFVGGKMKSSVGKVWVPTDLTIFAKFGKSELSRWVRGSDATGETVSKGRM